MPNTSTQRFGFSIIVAAAVFVVIWGIRSVAGILNPILLAAVITITLLPVPSAFIKRGIKPGYALLLTILLVVLVLVLLVWLVLGSLAQLNTELPSLTELFGGQTTETTDADLTSAEQLAQEVMLFLDRQRFSELFAGIIARIGSSIGQFFMTLLIFVFMLYTGMSLPNLSRLGINVDSSTSTGILNLTSDVRRYMVVTTGINLVVGIANTILLAIMGVPFAVLWGLISWVLGYIPAVGYWLALIPPVLLAYAQYGIRSALIVFIGYGLINGTAANIISPRVLGKELKVSPLIVFISVFVWASLLGGIGAILAMPLTLLLIVILDNFEATQWIAGLMRYVPGSEQEADAAAVDRAKGLLARARDVLPTFAKKPSEPSITSLPE